ncbi:MAG: sprT domain-containing protein [Flavobacteriales bacterium CG_4_9_14_3_um_filter_40_17]|nr:MAG: sprT domain-containing protein [Flavobacteriales bacterium CG_4_9_14_3_um_filter_40_17]
MIDKLKPYLPEAAASPVFELIKNNRVHLKIVNKRRTKHGDYRPMDSGGHQITVNAEGNPYRFLITTLHEIAHLLAFEKYGRKIKPHGMEWKQTFQHLALPYLRPEIFPSDILPVIARHFKNPTASSDTDLYMSQALRRYDSVTGKNYIFEIPKGIHFKVQERLFKKGKQRTKRFECMEISTGRIYLFHPNAEVETVENKQT